MRPEPDCSRCGLCQGRTQVVYPDGNPDKGIVFVGEGPGESEDLEGRPFVGKSGKLLTQMMERHGFSRKDVLITNTVKCRPPNNRDPTPEEMAACRPFLMSELKKARLVVGLGKSACRDLIGFEGKMAEIVNIPIEIDIEGHRTIFLPTYHPAATIYNRESRSQLDETLRIVSEWLKDTPSGSKRKGFVIDVDGTLCWGHRPIPGAADYIKSLKERGIPFIIGSNNSSMSTAEYMQKLRGMGFDVDRVLTATMATVRYLKERYPGKTVYAIGSDGFRDELVQGGIQLSDLNPDIVLLSYDKTINFEKFNKAAHFINKGAKFIATHPDVTCNSEDGFDVDIGALSRTIVAATGVEPDIIAKPESTMAKMASEMLDLPLSDIHVVGDRLYTDVAFANKNGMVSVLVLTGDVRSRDEVTAEYRTDYIFDSIEGLDNLLQ